MDRLEGRVALVTGAASGIGRATAFRLAEEGAAVLVTDIQVEAGEATVRQIVDAGHRAAFQRHDVSSEAEWEAATARAVEEFGGLDILVNNAGMGDIKPIEDTTLEEWERTVAIDQTGVFLGMKVAASLLKRSGNASVVNISSIFGTSGGFGTSPAYHAAKGAVRTLTKNIALHWATEGVRVNSIHPGFIDTPDPRAGPRHRHLGRHDRAHPDGPPRATRGHRRRRRLPRERRRRVRHRARALHRRGLHGALTQHPRKDAVCRGADPAAYVRLVVVGVLQKRVARARVRDDEGSARSGDRGAR